jgi:galactokinase
MDIVDSYRKYFNEPKQEVELYFSPGRVNLIGEHIDYNGGHVFPAALSIGITAAVGKRNDDLIVLKSESFENEVIIDPKEDIKYGKKYGWGNYARGMFKFIEKPKKSLNIYLKSNLPDGAGLSSSASLEMIIGYILSSEKKNNDDFKKRLSLLGKKVENEFIGVHSGIMDQFSIVFGKKDHGILLDTHSLNYEYVPVFLKNYKLVIINTNKKRELADSAYNERKYQCEKAFKIIKSKKNINNLCEADMDDLKYIKDSIIRKRARHVITEEKRVLESIQVLKNGDLKKFGELLNQSHKSLKDDFEVTGKELDTIVNSSQKQESCIGARMTGAGFGGCAIALIKDNKIEKFKEDISEKYSNKIGYVPSFYICDIDDGVKRLGRDFDG